MHFTITESSGQTDPGGQSGPPISVQDIQQTTSKNLSKTQSGLPFSGHSTGTTLGQYYPGQTSEQGFNTGMPLPSQLGTGNVGDTSSGQPKFVRPPTTGQKTTVPLLPGQQNLSNLQGQQNMSSSSLPEQRSLSSSLIQGQLHLPGHPLPTQQNHNNTLTQGVHGQQNLSGPPLSKQNLSGPILQGQSNLSGPPLPGPPLQTQQYPSLQGQQKSGHSYLEPTNMPISNLHGQSSLSVPPLMGQQNISPPPMPGQQNIITPPLTNQQSFNRPPLVGQQNLSSPQVHPPVPGQPVGQMINPAMNLPQSGQRQYTSGPPMQGQSMGNPLGFNRNPPGAMPNYQHTGYQSYNNVCLQKYF